MSARLPQVGDRVRVTGVMANDPDPIPVGTEGTVTGVSEFAGQIFVAWDNGRRLILLAEDPWVVIS